MPGLISTGTANGSNLRSGSGNRANEAAACVRASVRLGRSPTRLPLRMAARSSGSPSTGSSIRATASPAMVPSAL